MGVIKKKKKTDIIHNTTTKSTPNLLRIILIDKLTLSYFLLIVPEIHFHYK